MFKIIKVFVIKFSLLNWGRELSSHHHLNYHRSTSCNTIAIFKDEFYHRIKYLILELCYKQFVLKWTDSMNRKHLCKKLYYLKTITHFNRFGYLYRIWLLFRSFYCFLLFNLIIFIKLKSKINILCRRLKTYQLISMHHKLLPQSKNYLLLTWGHDI